MDHKSRGEIVSRLISSGISVQTQCHHAKVVIIPLIPRDKKFSLRRGNINITNSLLESQRRKYKLYTYNNDPKWLSADGSLNESLFYSNLQLVREGNELLGKEIVAFYKSLKSHYYPTARSYKNVSSFYLKNSDF